MALYGLNLHLKFSFFFVIYFCKSMKHEISMSNRETNKLQFNRFCSDFYQFRPLLNSIEIMLISLFFSLSLKVLYIFKEICIYQLNL